ncbi:hypothetical protein LBMAG56_54060 [Verrucomicrobiota bacterium]|nr:hypothetical protein LBMAG56_54060 [Verrucomicrobiota bacterium]
MIENTIKTIEAQVPDAVWQQARDLAARERIPLEQLISLAVTQTVGAWSNESCLAARAKRGSREKFLQALEQVPDVEAPEWDRLPEGYRRGQ